MQYVLSISFNRNMFRCGRVQGLDVHEGLLLFGLAHYFIIDGFTMLKNREICDISTLSDEYVPVMFATLHVLCFADHVLTLALLNLLYLEKTVVTYMHVL